MVLFFLSQFAFVHIMLRPSSGYVPNTTTSPTLVAVAPSAVFALVSVLFWAYFRFRRSLPRSAEQQVCLAEMG